MDEYQDFLKDIEGYTNSGDLVKVVWCGDQKGTPWKQQRIQQKIRQKKLKNIILDNEKRLEGIGDRMNKIEDLADKIDSTRNIKGSQDLTNRLLVEVLLTLNEQLLTATNFYEAQAMLFYTGEQSDEQFREEQEVLQKEEKQGKKGYTQRLIERMEQETRSPRQRARDANQALLLKMKEKRAQKNSQEK